MRTYFFLVTLSAIGCFALSRWLAAVATERNWARRQGDGPEGAGVPRLGGVALLGAMLTTLLLLFWWDNDVTRQLKERPLEGLGLLAAATTVFLLGLYDDLRGARPWQKLLVQGSAGLMLFFSGYQVELLTNPFTGRSHELGWLALPVTLAWLIAISNAFNLIDGLDGLAAGVGFFATLSLFLLAIQVQNPFMAAIAATAAGALLGFLPNNFAPARIYLGDSGSLTVGLVLAALAVRSSQKGPVLITLAIPLMIFGLPLLDAGVTTVRRFLSGHPIFRRDEEHLHHRLLKIGMTHRAAVLALYGVAGFFALSSLLLVNYQSSLAPLIALLCGVLAWVVVRLMQYPEFTELDSHVRLALGTQRTLLRNQIQLRKSTNEIRTARTVVEAWEVTGRVLGMLEFERATCELALGPGAGSLCLRWSDPAELPATATGDRDGWTMAVPLVAGGRRIGTVEMVRSLAHKTTLFRVTSLLELVAEAFAGRVAELYESQPVEEILVAPKSA
jgi:UDP-GlcNAc:undecaprenyl-phosphate GlcNAc-1-phosphate transferase